MNETRPAGSLPPSKPPAGPAPPRRPVCAPGRCRPHPTADRPGTGERTMLFPSWLRHLRSVPAPGERDRRRRNLRRSATHRLKLEVLEDRIVPAFLAPVDYAVGYHPSDMEVGDFNNDGRLDLVTANRDNDTVSVLLGNADGTFRPATTSATGATPVSLAVGDFNGDGRLDLATANRSGSDVSVLLGNGNGTFQAPRHIDVDATPNSVAVGDFNGDGKIDLVVTSNFYSPDS